MQQSIMAVRLTNSAVFLLLTLAVASCGDDVATTSSVSAANETTTAAPTTTTSPEPASPTPTTAPATTTSSIATTTTTVLSVPPIPSGEFRIEPAGPYREGDRVTLLAAETPMIDLWNSAPRLCASIDGASEICSADALRPTPVFPAPNGTQAVTVQLTRTHFGAQGYSDCIEDHVVCRLIWRNEAGGLLTGPILEFVGDTPSTMPLFTAEVGPEPGQVLLHTNDFAFPTDLASIDPATLDEIATIIADVGDYDPDKIEIEWSIVQVCGFGPGSQTIGSDGLVDAPSWWWRHDVEDETEALGYFGPICDWNAVEGSLNEIGDDGVLDLRVRRNIYGYGGWLDCATSSCFLSIGWTWLHPEPGGGQIGAEGESHRVMLDIPESWPTQFPTISILEPAPYTRGQTVTVVATGVEREQTAIGWCPGGDGYCRWKFASVDEGTATVEWPIEGTADSCGANRCYFAIDSASEGLAPPAIVLVPIVD